MPRRNRFRTRRASPGWGVSDQLSGRPDELRVVAVDQDGGHRLGETARYGVGYVDPIDGYRAGRGAVNFAALVGHGLAAMVLLARLGGMIRMAVLMLACNVDGHLVMRGRLCRTERTGRCEQGALQRADEEKHDRQRNTQLRGPGTSHVADRLHILPSTMVRDFCKASGKAAASVTPERDPVAEVLADRLIGKARLFDPPDLEARRQTAQSRAVVD